MRKKKKKENSTQKVTDIETEDGNSRKYTW